eukprot:845512_1
MELMKAIIVLYFGFSWTHAFFFDDFWAKSEQSVVDDNDPNVDHDVHELTLDTVAYVIGALIVALLVVNVGCLTYANCCKAHTKKKNNYERAQVVVTSDDDMEVMEQLKAN